MRKKKCANCGKVKTAISFGYRDKSRNRRQSWCKLCLKQHTGGPSSREHRKAVKLQYIKYLQVHPCVDCGETNIVVLEADHVRGKKKFNVSEMVVKGFSWEEITEELAKCEIVCANCHKKRTSKAQNWYKQSFVDEDK